MFDLTAVDRLLSEVRRMDWPGRNGGIVSRISSAGWVRVASRTEVSSRWRRSDLVLDLLDTGEFWVVRFDLIHEWPNLDDDGSEHEEIRLTEYYESVFEQCEQRMKESLGLPVVSDSLGLGGISDALNAFRGARWAWGEADLFLVYEHQDRELPHACAAIVASPSWLAALKV